MLFSIPKNPKTLILVLGFFATCVGGYRFCKEVSSYLRVPTVSLSEFLKLRMEHAVLTDVELGFERAVPNPDVMTGNLRSSNERYYVPVREHDSKNNEDNVLLRLSAADLGELRERTSLVQLRVTKLNKPTFSDEEWEALVNEFGKPAIASAAFLEREQVPSA